MPVVATYGPVGRRIKSRAPDLAAIHLASIQMGEQAQFGPVERGSGAGFTVVLMSFPPVNRRCPARILEPWNENVDRHSRQ